MEAVEAAGMEGMEGGGAAGAGPQGGYEPDEARGAEAHSAADIAAVRAAAIKAAEEKLDAMELENAPEEGQSTKKRREGGEYGGGASAQAQAQAQDFAVVQCRQRGCEQTVPRGERAAHEQTCPHRMVQCGEEDCAGVCKTVGPTPCWAGQALLGGHVECTPDAGRPY